MIKERELKKVRMIKKPRIFVANKWALLQAPATIAEIVTALWSLI